MAASAQAEGPLVQVRCGWCGVPGRVAAGRAKRPLRCARCARAAQQRSSAPEAPGRLDRLRERLADQGLGPARSEAGLRDLAAALGVRLPGSYRSFLREVGDGAACGPLHGLRPLPLPGPDLAAQAARAGTAFRFRRARWWDDEPDPEVRAALRERAREGLLELGSEGCGIEWVLLLGGPLRGEVWLRSELGIAPAAPALGFLSWLERLLDPGQAGWWTATLDRRGASPARRAHPLRDLDQAMCWARPPEARLEPLEVEHPACRACAAWLQARCREDGRVRCVSDPGGVTVLQPDAPPARFPPAADPGSGP